MLLASAAFGQTPAIQENGVVSGAGSSRVGIAPGSLISIFGTELAAGLSNANSVPLSTTLGDVNSVTINGTAVPLVLVSGGRINAQLPWTFAAGPADVIVNRAGTASAARTVMVNQFAPSLFGINVAAMQNVSTNPDGSISITQDTSGVTDNLQAIATNADGTLTAPENSIPGVTSHPAAAGDTVTLFATGLGAVTPSIDNGMPPGDTPRQTSNPATVLVGDQQGTVSSAGLSSQFVGVYQLSVVVPGGVAAAAAVPVKVQMSDTAISDPVTIALQ